MNRSGEGRVGSVYSFLKSIQLRERIVFSGALGKGEKS
jgi:hypothetical protein